MSNPYPNPDALDVSLTMAKGLVAGQLLNIILVVVFWFEEQKICLPSEWRQYREKE